MLNVCRRAVAVMMTMTLLLLSGSVNGVTAFAVAQESNLPSQAQESRDYTLTVIEEPETPMALTTDAADSSGAGVSSVWAAYTCLALAGAAFAGYYVYRSRKKQARELALQLSLLAMEDQWEGPPEED